MTKLFFVLFFPLLALSTQASEQYLKWNDYLGSADSAQYSGLQTINKSNVNQLEQVWAYTVGGNRRLAFNPLVIGKVLYVLGREKSVAALDATTGKELWNFPTKERKLTSIRGFNYWENSKGTDRRLLFMSDEKLFALDAGTGKLVSSFGKEGAVDLREGLGRAKESIESIRSDSPGRVYKDLLILGSVPGEGYEYPPGDIRAYNVITGKLVWTFHTIPHPGEYGYKTWPKDAWKKAGGANAWGELSLDSKRGIVYIPTASPGYDFYGGDRKGKNLFANSLLALDAKTGKRLWHYQMVHHDLWDYDLAAAPKLLTVNVNGKKVDVVAQTSKHGFVFVFDRVTGKPIWPIEERPVPKSDVPGEAAWPTQPFPTKPPPFSIQTIHVDDVNPYITDEKEKEIIRKQILEAKNDGLFTPPALKETLQMPGSSGGASWGSGAIDPSNGTLFVLAKNFPTVIKLSEVVPLADLEGKTPYEAGSIIYSRQCAGCHANSRPDLSRMSDESFMALVKGGRGDMPGFTFLKYPQLRALIKFLKRGERAVQAVEAPANERKGEAPTKNSQLQFMSQYMFLTAKNAQPLKPPWTTLTAYDLNEGKIKWQIPAGVSQALAKKGIRDTGTLMIRGGPVVTAGGLIFLGTAGDLTIRAFDKETGAIVWEKKVDFDPQGVPAIYEVDGRQFVVFCGSRDIRSPPGVLRLRIAKIMIPKHFLRSLTIALRFC